MTAEKRTSGKVRLSFLILGFLFLILSSICFTGLSGAADYPGKPIQIIAAFPPGGGSDIVARLISPKLSDLLGQPVVVVNKTGGGGVIGTYAALTSPPDGYTIFVYSPAMILAPLLYKNVTFDLVRDFAMLNLPVLSPIILVVAKDSPWLTLEELVADGRKNPGKIACSVAGYGTMHHFAAELFKMETATDITSVPMDGAAPAVTAVLGGHVQFNSSDIGSVHKYLKAGSLRALAVMSKKRLAEFPDVPTAVERGFPNLISVSYQGLAAHGKTPRNILEVLERACKEAIGDKETADKLERAGWIVEGLGPKESVEFLTREQKSSSEVAKVAKIVPK